MILNNHEDMEGYYCSFAIPEKEVSNLMDWTKENIKHDFYVDFGSHLEVFWTKGHPPARLPECEKPSS